MLFSHNFLLIPLFCLIVKTFGFGKSFTGNFFHKNTKITELTRNNFPREINGISPIATKFPINIDVRNLNYFIGDNELLSNITFSIGPNDKIGLVSSNGKGKTTLLRLLAKELFPDSGTIAFSDKEIKPTLFDQEYIEHLNPNFTLYEEVLSIYQEEISILDGLQNISLQIDQQRLINSSNSLPQSLIQKYEYLQEQAILQDAYNLDQKVTRALFTFGFSKQDFNRTVSTFSGGWKMRIGFVKYFSRNSVFMLLDEPTNHLDLEASSWLENTLASLSIPMVVVSHDREFLNKISNRIFEIESNKVISYKGNYQSFFVEKQQRLASWVESYSKQQKFIKEEEEWIKKAKGIDYLNSQAKSRALSLEKLKNSPWLIQQPPRVQKWNFQFPVMESYNNPLIKIENISFSFPHMPSICEMFSVEINYGNKIGLLGPNGSGKTTFLKVLSGLLQPNSGKISFNRNLCFQYFSQEQAERLSSDNTIIDMLLKDCPNDITSSDIRALLGQFQFKGDDIYKKINNLSGGEKVRVSICNLLLKPSNLLLLDEPTNHLDLNTREILENALIKYKGAVICISHDRYFTSRIANSLLVFDSNSEKKIINFDGDLYSYISSNGDVPNSNRIIECISPNPNIFLEETKQPKIPKNIGGSGINSGKKSKGVKNAKRFNRN